MTDCVLVQASGKGKQSLVTHQSLSRTHEGQIGILNSQLDLALTNQHRCYLCM